MVMPGEGGVGKLRTIQSMMEIFKQLNVAHTFVKNAYTGIAVRLIDGRTIHMIAQLPTNRRERSAKATCKLVTFWCDKCYLIIDEMSMISCQILAHVSLAMSMAKSMASSDTG